MQQSGNYAFGQAVIFLLAFTRKDIFDSRSRRDIWSDFLFVSRAFIYFEMGTITLSREIHCLLWNLDRFLQRLKGPAILPSFILHFFCIIWCYAIVLIIISPFFNIMSCRPLKINGRFRAFTFPLHIWSFSNRICLISNRVVLASCLAYSPTVKMEVTCSSETFVDFRLVLLPGRENSEFPFNPHLNFISVRNLGRVIHNVTVRSVTSRQTTQQSEGFPAD
jgi:hypothetical protein